MIKSITATQAWYSRPAVGPWEARPKHRFPQVAIMAAPTRQPVLLRLLWTCKALLGSVIQARDPQGQQLDSRGGDRLMIIAGTSRKPQLLAVNMIMIIKHGHQLVAQIAVRSERRRPSLETAEVASRVGQSAGKITKCEPAATDVQRGIEVPADRVEVAAGKVIVRDLADQEEIPFAEVGGELLDRPAEVPRLFIAHVLNGVDAETVAIGQCDPIHVRLRQKAQRP